MRYDSLRGADHHRGAEVDERRTVLRERLGRWRRGSSGARSARRRARRGRRFARRPRRRPSRRSSRPRGARARRSPRARCRGPSSGRGSRRSSHALAGAAQAARVEHVALVQFVAGGLQVLRAAAVAHEAANVGRRAAASAFGQPASHEAGGTSDECSHRSAWYQALPVRNRGGLGARAHVQLREDARYVHAGRLLRHVEALADLPVGRAAGHQREHVALAGGEAERVLVLAR